MEIWQIWLAIALALCCTLSGHWGRWRSSGILFHRFFGLADYGICRFHLNIIHLCTSVHAQISFKEERFA